MFVEWSSVCVLMSKIHNKRGSLHHWINDLKFRIKRCHVLLSSVLLTLLFTTVLLYNTYFVFFPFVAFTSPHQNNYSMSNDYCILYHLEVTCCVTNAILYWHNLKYRFYQVTHRISITALSHKDHLNFWNCLNLRRLINCCSFIVEAQRCLINLLSIQIGKAF